MTQRAFSCLVGPQDLPWGLLLTESGKGEHTFAYSISMTLVQSIKRGIWSLVPKSSHELLCFFVTQRIKGFEISDTPYFDEEALAFFRDQIREARFYLEYGCGGSTVVAAKLGKELISVEGDKYFLGSVMKKIGPYSKGKFIHANIGQTGPWGLPLFKTATKGRVARWKTYPEAPWAEIKKRGKMPDLVLVDGRFRVACALTSIKHLASAPNVKILVDDYVEDRPYYQTIERFATLRSRHGRMALFSPKSFNESEIDQTIRTFESDWR